MTPLENYLRACRDAGCPPAQVKNFTDAGIVLQPRQLFASATARSCDRADGPSAIGYGGARGGGKSHWLLAQMGADDCQRVPGLKCLLLRKVGKANLEHFEDLRRRLFGALKHDFSAHRGILTFANGSRIIAGHFQCEKDIDAYLGLEYDVIGIEEATTLSHRKYQDICTCCRSSKPLPLSTLSTLAPSDGERARVRGLGFSTLAPSDGERAGVRGVRPSDLGLRPSLPLAPSDGERAGVRGSLSTLNPQLSTPYWRPRIYTTTNPGGVGHAWYRTRFILPFAAGKETDTRFIPAKVSDNRFNNPEYARVLANLTGWQRRAWLEGDWDLAAGQFFTTFRQDAHVLADFDETRAVDWFGAFDYGFTHYTVFLLGCTDADGRLFVVDEHCQRLWLPQRHSESIKALLGRHGLRPSQLRHIAAGADVFSRQSDGTTIASTYARLGLKFRPANTDRINGWAEVLARLGDPAAGLQPTLFLLRRCARLLETLPAMQHDPNRNEDVCKVDADEDGVGGDDAADALRYLVATRRRNTGAVVI